MFELNRATQIPIAMFHHVSNRKDWDSLRPFVVTESTFLKFLDSVEKSGYTPVNFIDLNRGVTCKKPVIITFDDCGKHLFEFVIPELVKRRMTAVFYMPTAYLGGFNDWNVEKGQSQVELMDESDLIQLERLNFEVGGHSHQHIHLGRIDANNVRLQAKRCYDTLSSILQTPPVSFAYPFGSLPLSCIQSIKETGFDYGCSIFSPKNELNQLRRFIVHDQDSALSLRLKMSRLYGFYRSWSDAQKPASSWS
jgi:peptidoglycan/xylan/chitin deacetylase (PgdA/CDA1 family)